MLRFKEVAHGLGWSNGLVTWKKQEYRNVFTRQMVIISFISIQLPQTYPLRTCMHTLPNTLSTTATLLQLSILSPFTFFSRRRRRLYEVFSDKRPKRHLNTARERQKDKERGGEGWEGVGEKEVDPDWVYQFFYIDLKQIFTVSAVQATGSEISPSAQAPEDVIQTGCPSLTMTGFAQLWENVLIIRCAELS